MTNTEHVCENYPPENPDYPRLRITVHTDIYGKMYGGSYHVDSPIDDECIKNLRTALNKMREIAKNTKAAVDAGKIIKLDQ